MSGTKKDRESLKNRFKKGMYPTEDDFADVFESYVHKDDTIKMSQVVLEEGGESVGEVIDKKADKKTLDAFIEEVDTVLETVRDAETGEITKTVIQDLSKRIKDAENDIADTSNTAEKNENAIAKILSILGKQDGETVSELAARFTALSGSYATVYAFVSKVKAFLESADASDETINRWQEIESFLQGITDKETLTGLLERLKTEIMQSVPKGNFLEQVADLDSYDNAPEGKIVQYIGQTNEKYTRNFTYEKVGASFGKVGDKGILIQEIQKLASGSVESNLKSNSFLRLTGEKIQMYGGRNTNEYAIITNETPKIGDFVTELKYGKKYIITNLNDKGDFWYVTVNDGDQEIPNLQVYKATRTLDCFIDQKDNRYILVPSGLYIEGLKGPSYLKDIVTNSTVYADFICQTLKTDITVTSWQHIPSSPVIY